MKEKIIGTFRFTEAKNAYIVVNSEHFRGIITIQNFTLSNEGNVIIPGTGEVKEGQEFEIDIELAQ